MEDLTEEQRMLQDSLDGILSTTTDPVQLWPQLAALGMLGLSLPESVGGAALGTGELMLFAKTFGKAVMPTPFFATEVLAMPLFAQLSGHAEVARLLDDLTGGLRVATVALDDRERVVAKSNSNGGYLLSGVKTVVPAGSIADVAVIVARLDNVPSLFLLDLRTEGVEKRAYFPTGPATDADLVFKDVSLNDGLLLAQGEDAERLISEAEVRGQLVTCAEMFGGMEKLLEVTLEYLRERKQFGRTLANFQVLQHAAVDMYVELETARSMLDYGIRMFDAPDAQRGPALDAVKLKMNNAAKLISETAVQLHGGIGMTQESVTGRIFARLTVARMFFGDRRNCMSRLLSCDSSIALT